MMNKRNTLLGILLVVGVVALGAFTSNTNLPSPFEEEIVSIPADTIPIQPRYGDFINDEGSNPFDLADPSIIKQEVEYDPVSDRYIISERLGEEYYRMPTYLTFEEYLNYRAKKQEEEYFRELRGVASGRNGLDGGDPLSKIDLENSLSDRLFGGSGVDIQVQGNIDMLFGFNYQYTDNPAWPLRQRRTGPLFLFDFEQLQMNVDGQIGEKLNFSTNYNAQATFDFDNQMKLEYASDAFSEDDIIKTIEAGNVSLPLQGSLIQGAQNLFGLKTQLQFGHLYVTAIASQQKSEREEIEIKGGSQVREFEVGADEYDVNRHFFLSHYNREVFEESLENIPQIKGLFTIKQIEVWVTNDRNANTPGEGGNRAARDIVALTDIGESDRFTDPQRNIINVLNPPTDINNIALPDSASNTMFTEVLAGENIDKIDEVVKSLKGKGLIQSRDFEKTQARMLREGQEYTVNKQLGYISLNINLQPYHVLGVSYAYSYNGKTYTVGQLSNNKSPVTGAENDQQVLFVKMLKGTAPNIGKPIWDLMMKNIYNIGAYQVDREDFRLDVFYEDPGKGQRRFLPDTRIGGKPLLQVFNLDRLNSRLDPQRDGAFDFVENLTIYPRTGRIMFPALEPFGSYLRDSIQDETLAEKYIYQELYDETITSAREVPEKNRFTIKGRYRNSVSSEISLGAFNIPPGSVTVTAGKILQEGIDYEIDYNIGRIKILNDAILASGQTIRVRFEDNTLFGLQSKVMLGLRADYKPSDDVNFGATYMHLFERPLTAKVNIGDDPISNKMYGFDMNVTKDAPWLTRLVDKIPFIDTKAPSSISVFAEGAVLKPGHARGVNEVKNVGTPEEEIDKSGTVYLDDFEGSANPLSLMIQPNQWQIASVPQEAEVFVEKENGTQHKMFKEADALDLENDRYSSVNRARLNWYRIDPQVRDENSEASAYTRRIDRNEVFPNQQIAANQLSTFLTFDLAYYPEERGPYNFDVPNGVTSAGEKLSEGIENSGALVEPATRWGGLMRDLSNSRADFELSNVEYIEMWVMSPFLEGSTEGMEGDLYIDLGNISEDIMRDSRLYFENGLPSPTNPDREVDQTDWGNVPRARKIVNAFDNDPATRPLQDVGLDGLNNEEERVFYQDWLNEVGSAGNAADPANDDFVHYFDGNFNDASGVQDRYQFFNNPQGNSPIVEGNANRSFSATLTPDTEDLNNDNTLSETEAYFQYRIPIRRKGIDGEQIGMSDEGKGFITDERVVRDAQNGDRVWYRFRIPLDDVENRRAVGGIQDFRSIRFLRMYMTGFEEPVTLRMAELNLVSNQWRRYRRDLEELGHDQVTFFDMNAVNIERNSSRQPFKYVLPEGIQRERGFDAFSTLQNEQSLALQVRGLQEDDSRSIFKNLDLDMRNYENMKMFVHAESLPDSICNNVPENGDLSVFIRLGSDFKRNYYEYEIPLTFSDPAVQCPGEGLQPTTTYVNEVWRSENNFDVSLDMLVEAKKAIIVALQNGTISEDETQFSFPENNGRLSADIQLPVGHRISVSGRPSLGFVKSVMVGIRNNSTEEQCGEIWINELRLSGLEQKQSGGYAGIARMDMQLADFGALSASTSYSSIGFGAIDQRVQERSLEETQTYDLALNLELGKFLPAESGVKLPFYAAYSNTTTTPKYDPYDLDIELQESQTDKEQAQDVNLIKSYSFTNVRKERSSKAKKNGEARKPKPWDISNFSASYTNTEENRKDPFIKENKIDNEEGILDYSYSLRPKYIKPFEKLPKNEWLKFLRDFNFNPIPNTVNFSTKLDRRHESITYRFTEEFDQRYQTYLNKQFTWDRTYGLSWDLAKSLKVNFDARNYGVIDEFDESSDSYFDGPNYNEQELTQRRKDAILDGLQNLGRTKTYDHDLGVSFTVPTKSFPFLDWTNIRAQYSANYAWTSAPLDNQGNLETFGNVIENGQKRQITADFNFEQLYNKSDYLKKINRPRRGGRSATPRTSRPNSKLKDGGKEEDAKKKKKKREPSTGERALIRPLLFLRKARFNYSEQYATVLPGFVPQSRFLGQSGGFDSPGWDFVAGWQPTIRTLRLEDQGTSSDWLHSISNAKGADSWITDDIYQRNEVIQNYTQSIDAKVTLEPIPDFRIDLDASRNFTENHTRTFKDEIDDGNSLWEHSVPYNVGSLDLTYYSLRTLFQDDLTEIVDRFAAFKAARADISQQIGEGLHQEQDQADNGYTYGYGRKQQDVLIPAFLAIYAGNDPNVVEVSQDYARDVLFKQLPFPNWRVTYNGLAKLPIFEDIFQQIGISHSYTSRLGINSFNTTWGYLNNPVGLTEGGDFFSRLEVPEISIREGFSPLIAINLQTKNNISFNFDINKNRTLSTDFQGEFISEQQSKDITIGFGWLMENVDIGFLQNLVSQAANQNKDKDKTDPSQSTPFGNNRGGSGGANPGDLNITFDFSLRDDVTIVHELEPANRDPTRGTRALSISPALEYQIHEQLAIRLFVDYSKTVPKVSSSYPITSARGGLVVRFMLQ